MQDAIADAIPDLLPPLYRRARHLVWSGGLAVAPEDLAHDAIAIALGNAERFSGGNLAGWLHTIMQRQALNLGRSARSRRRRELPVGDGLQGDGDGEGGNGLADIPVEASQPAELECRQILSLLAELKPEEQVILRLHVIEGCSYEEIGACLGLPLGTVRSRLSRAREELRACSEGRSTRKRPIAKADGVKVAGEAASLCVMTPVSAGKASKHASRRCGPDLCCEAEMPA